MKVKTSVTLTGSLLDAIDRQQDFRSRSDFIETAVRRFLAHRQADEIERRDLEIIDRRADALNAEAQDVLAYQAPL
jgi:Arc/MetJ-type ribon-helix-helix transcriptional regulator